MNSHQIALVQSTFKTIEPIAQVTGELMYQRLFELDPSIKPLFKGDIKQQALMLMTAIGLAVKGLDRPDSIEAAVKALGNRHRGYGVSPNDYPKFGAALLWALEQSMGDAFTPDVKDAWVEAFGMLAKQVRAATAP